VKLAPQRIKAFLRDPAGCSVALLFGDDVGLIQERSMALVRAVAGSLDDPFLVLDLPKDRLADLPTEAASLPLTGGRRAIRAREIGESALPVVTALLKRPGPALVVLEAPGLASRSKLRLAVEAASDGVAIGCYPDDPRQLEATIREALAADRITVDPDALRWLTTQLGADRASTRAELEKLALYAGAGGRVDLDMAMACIGDLAGLSLDDAVFAATEGRVDLADRAVQLAIGEGSSAIEVLRIGLNHLQRLHRARLLVDNGAPPDDAMKSVRPPVFFRRVGSFSKALGLWSSAALAAGIAALTDAERECKRTGAPDLAICRHAILAVARRSAEMAKR
jgi:DNA polymerase-3 subunit delta